MTVIASASLQKGESQAILRDNEIINSLESGLTAIAQSRVDLGTDDEPGNNVFRSNRKLDIQNATSEEIPAVGTEVKGDTVGDINFERGTFVATNNSDNTFEDLPPLPSRDTNRPQPKLNIPAPVTSSEITSSLPSPPPVSENDTGNKELIFTPSSSSSEVVSDVEPVPYAPQV